MPSAMIAFVPRETSATELARDNDGALPADELHTTVVFLSDDEEELPPRTLDAAMEVASGLAESYGPIEVQVAGRGQLGSEDPMAEVLFLNSPEMDDVRMAVWQGMEGREFREQFRPWIPHMTLSYGATEFPDVSSIVFDRIRVAVDDENFDFELSATTSEGESSQQELASSTLAATMGDDGNEEGGSMGTPFRLMMAPMGVSTGDGRRFAEDSLSPAPLPFALEWAREKDMGHDGSVVVGTVRDVEVTGSQVWAIGELLDDVDPDEMPRLAEDVAEAKKLLTEGVIGPSVDLDDFEAHPVRAGTDEPLTEDDLESMSPDDFDDIELFVTQGRIRAATLVSIPAFIETSEHILLGDDAANATGSEETSLVAAVIGTVDLPVADRATEWDGDAARGRVFDLCTDGDTVDTDCVSRAFLWRDPDANPETQGAYSLGFADVINGELQIVPQGIAATAGGRGVDEADIPEEDKARVRSRICSIYDQVRDQIEDWPECPFERDESADETQEDTDMASVVASLTQPELPSVADLDYPAELAGGLTPITYDWENGRVYGHIAPRSSCHEGFSGRCITPPLNEDYSLFHRHPVRTRDGGTVWAGRITAGGHHPMDTESLTAATAAYDAKDTAAYVRSGEDEHGIWVSGIIQPGLSANTKRILERQKVSGDWRPTENGLRMVEVLALQPGPKHLSEPGFPVTVREKDGQTMALVACLGPFPDEAPAAVTASADIEAAVTKAMSELLSRQREREALKSELEV